MTAGTTHRMTVGSGHRTAAGAPRNMTAGVPGNVRVDHSRSMAAGLSRSMLPGSPQSMAAGPHQQPLKSSGTQDPTSRQYFEHSSGQRIYSDAVLVESIRKEYPELHLTVVPTFSCNILGYAGAGHAGIAPIDNEKDRHQWTLFVPPPTRLNGGRGVIGENVKFGKFLIDWKSKEYIVYVVLGNDGPDAFSHTYNQYILSPSVESTNRLILDAGVWTTELHQEVWVFDQGYWSKSSELYASVEKASWDDVILDKDKKESIINDVDSFFDSRDTYERLKVPWKRGVIYYGPPGNGKTISIKAMMHQLYKRKPQIPTLYVRTLASFFGPEDSINQIFSLAREQAPCYLIFEDLDSVVTDEVRSYFLVNRFFSKIV